MTYLNNFIVSIGLGKIYAIQIGKKKSLIVKREILHKVADFLQNRRFSANKEKCKSQPGCMIFNANFCPVMSCFKKKKYKKYPNLT